MAVQGVVLEVAVMTRGAELTADATLGDTVLTVDDESALVEPDGAPAPEADIEGTVYTVASIGAGTVTLSTGVAEDLLSGTLVRAVPPVVEKLAMVQLSGNEEPISATVGGAFYDRLADGIREPENRETVLVDMVAGSWAVVDILGAAPTLDGAYLDPATMPPAPLSPEVEAQISDLEADVAANSGELDVILGSDSDPGRLQNVEETATAARNLANTADGRVSMSDYEPSADDVSYIATDADGNPIIDPETGQPVVLMRNPGSIWFTRTRARVNLSTNPSFEQGLTGWTMIGLTVSRDLYSAAPAGSYIATLTNDTTANPHYLADDNGGARYPVTAGAVYTWSIFAEGVSGSQVGVYAVATFYDSAGAVVGTFNGAPVDLVVDDWNTLGGSVRPSVTATAPSGAVTMTGRVVHPVASAVWRADAALLEPSTTVDRYFDGDDYDCYWQDTPHASPSNMVGGKVLRLFELYGGGWVEKVFRGGATVVDINASEITHGALDGSLIADRSVPIDKLSGIPCTASEALAAGDLVNVYSAQGAYRARLAKAAPGYAASGYVLESVSSGATAYVYSYGYNPFITLAGPGRHFLSATPGEAVAVPPRTAGSLVQQVGWAVGPTVLSVVLGEPVTIE